jgi:glycosyltransferase involved in cell wall biosynthesis
MHIVPTLSIGMPVYNSADYLRDAVESILAQSFADFELIISDNASTDGTADVARELAERDPRVRYRRNATNVGLSGNWNLLVPLARGRLFKWAAGDDLLLPGFLERCVAAVDADPAVVLAYARAQFVDANGSALDLFDPGWHVVSERPSERLGFAIEAVHFVNPLHGVVRTDSLRRTRLIPAYPAGDYRLMAELTLLGKIVEIPEPLFVRRIHHGSTKGNEGNRSWLSQYWTGSTARYLRAGYWRLYRDHLGLLLRAPVSRRERVGLLARLGRRMIRSRRLLAGELVELLRP